MKTITPEQEYSISKALGYLIAMKDAGYTIESEVIHDLQEVVDIDRRKTDARRTIKGER